MSRRALYWLGVLLLTLLVSIPLAVYARNAREVGPETRLSDAWFRTRPPLAPRPDIMLVARDSKTVKEMGKPGHADYAAAIRKLKAAGAQWIVLDIDLDDRQGHAADQALWTAIADSHRTLVLVRYAEERGSAPDADELRGLRALEKSAHWQEFEVRPGTQEWDWLRFAPATSDFIHSAHGAGMAVTETSADPDKVLRRARSGYITKILYPVDTKQGKLTNYLAVVPSLSVITAVSAMGGDKYNLHYRFGDHLDFGGAAKQPLDYRGFTPIDYAGPAGTFPRVSLVDLLKKETDPNLFRNRIVFLGSTVPNDPLTDTAITPVGPMPRVEVTANQVQSFLSKRPLAEPYAAGFWSVILLAFLLGALIPAVSPRKMAITTVLAVLAYLLVGWVLFWTRSIMLPLVPLLVLTPVAVLIAACMAAWLRPQAPEGDVVVQDTGMAVGPGEALPGTPARRWRFPNTRGRV